MKKLLLFFAMAFCMLNTVSAELLITPTRVVFSERDRTQEVILVNTANESRTYNLSWSEMMQTNSSGYRRLNDDEKEAFAKASEFIRFTPRRITLGPGENQRIKLNLRRRATMEAPEYRSHLKFTVIPNEVLKEPNDGEEPTGLKMKLNLFLNYTIPVMIKNTNVNSTVSIDNVNFKLEEVGDNPASVDFDLFKNGDTSIIGDITLMFRRQGDDEFVPVGYNNNLTIYHENNLVRLNIPWIEPISIGAGELKIVFKGTKETADKVFTEAVVRI